MLVSLPKKVFCLLISEPNVRRWGQEKNPKQIKIQQGDFIQALHTHRYGVLYSSAWETHR